MHATVLLEHARRTDTHFDWMIDLPARPGGLTTFRLDAPWPDWDRLGRVGLRELPPHRRAWLTRQGRPSSGRGRVLRRGSGIAEVTGLHRHGWHLSLRWPDGPGVAAGEVRGRVLRMHRERWEFLSHRAPGILRPGVGPAR